MTKLVTSASRFFALSILWLRSAVLTVNADSWCIPGKILPNPCPEVATDDFLPAWCNTSASVADRIVALTSNLSIAEKAALLAKSGAAPMGSQTGPVPRLRYPLVHWWHEALHGVSWPGSGRATSWPAVLGVAASFNRSLFHALGELSGTEARAMCGVQSDVWSPVLNLLREPLWGRGQETPGEDPYLNSVYGIEFVSGLQGNHPRYIRVASTLKHFVAYDAPENNPSRESFNAKVTQQDLVDSYFPAFRSAIQIANASGLMCSYNALNGVPMCANPMLNSLVRDQWGLRGYIVSDCLAFDDIVDRHNFTRSLYDTIGPAYGAGMDLYNCGSLRSSQLESFMRSSAHNEALLTTSISNLLEVQFRLGSFDPPDLNPYSGLNLAKDVDTPAWRKLAKEAATQSFVLLANRDQRLPLVPSGKMALIGPHANASVLMQGDYKTTDPPFLVTPLQGFLRCGVNVSYSHGCDIDTADKSSIRAAVEMARGMDDVIVVAGLSSTRVGQSPPIETEEVDRTSLLLPGVQDELISAVAAAAKKPIVLVVMSGGAVDLSAAMDNHKVGAIMWAGYPGQSGGDAIAEALLGMSPPSGKLPMTWYFNNFTRQAPKTKMDMRPNSETGYPGRTYRFFRGLVLFSFGHGLTYAKFSHAIAAPAEVCALALHTQLMQTRGVPHLARSLVTVNISIHNHGDIASSTVVLLFLKPPRAGQANAPLRQLRGFERVQNLLPGHTRTVAIGLTAHDFALVAGSGKASIQEGAWELLTDAGGTSSYIHVTPATGLPAKELPFLHV